MIIVFQNNKITAVDKELLQILKCSLNDLSDKISQIDLALKSIQNSEINIENEIFKVKEKKLISIEDLTVYELTKTSELPLEIKENLNLTKKEENIEPLLGEFEIKPIEPSEDLTISQSISNVEENKPLLEEEPIETKDNTTINLETLPPSNLFQTDINNTDLTTPLQEPEIPQTKEISITFEDEFEEIEKTLALNKEEAQKLILEDLEKASKDFDMDIDSIKELYNDLINQIQTNKEAFYKAIKEKDYEAMHKIAHSLKGASLNLRISNLALILKTIDEKSKENISFDKLEFLVNNFYAFVEKVKSLENISQNTQTNLNIPPYLKNLILDTIKNYLSTQNEKKLKKDLKYIEKILNKKIASIEELKAIVKAEK